MASIFGNIDDLYLFCCVVEEGSLLAASRKLGLPVSTMSRRLSALEQRLAMRLLEKNGRELMATQTGDYAFKRLSSAMEQVEYVMGDLELQSQQVQGQLKVIMPHRIYGNFAGDVIARFMREYPKVSLDLVLSQDFVVPQTDRDLVVTFDITGLDEMVARPFFEAKHAFFASPEYLASHLPIEDVGDLSQHQWVAVSHDKDIPVYHQQALVDMVKIQPRLVVNDISAVIRATEQGFGIASLPLRHVTPERNLIRILPDYHRGKRQAYLVYRQRTHQPKALKLLIEALLANAPEPQLHFNQPDLPQ
ncbi:LysR family transcriptional regulator [Vibrio sp. CAU 1672]|uniref:LysR family transcriptional regulator n=1 Tax=Vibrio sp. CAU 1672 TaxID=3032594 RepID=UPI0023DACD65|nr:LysR family transcriptional regulator [Vibrio sp. CAU 1672]MDF2155233.1 LysR family transcriptional regulator [Vibrio sp. CAU 1672]